MSRSKKKSRRCRFSTFSKHREALTGGATSHINPRAETSQIMCIILSFARQGTNTFHYQKDEKTKQTFSGLLQLSSEEMKLGRADNVCWSVEWIKVTFSQAKPSFNRALLWHI